MEEPRSPLFPASSLAPGIEDSNQYFIPQLPDTPTVQTSSLQVYVVTTEKHLFVQGFNASEQEGRPPTLLRGCLVIRVVKPSKIRSISLVFKGSVRTDWPEGIPPKRNVYADGHDLVTHTWPFYQMETPVPKCGADIYVPCGKSGVHEDVSSLNLAESNTPQLMPIESATLFAANLVKRATSPLSGSSSNHLAPTASGLTSVLSALSYSGADDELKPGHFSPGYYVYNFEHPLPALTPETISLNFGHVAYSLEASITRVGAFKSNLTAKVPVDVVRIPSDNSVEENEPIIIEREWEDQLRYEIVVGSKSVVLDSYLPLSFRFIPLFGKVALHRIRVYMTENCNYYCNNKTVHRAEPVRKFLLLEHKAKKNKSLISKSGGLTDGPAPEDDEVLPREMEFQMFVPSTINKKYNYCMHPDTAYDDIQCDHWIKISLRISKQDPENPEKRKHFEILIDSPIHLCSPLAAHNHTLLPSYDMEPEFLPVYTPTSPPMSPEVTALDCSHNGGLGRLLLSAISGISGQQNGSPGARLDISRPLTPLEFHHILSLNNNDVPIERDPNIHLEANLYEPPDEEVLEKLGSPQAKPFSPQIKAFSPIASPLMSPVLSRQPTINPPSFEQPGVSQDVLPPAYEREDPAHIIASIALDDSRHGSDMKSVHSGSHLSGLGGEPNIKDILSRQLDQRSRNSQSDRESLRSAQTSHASDKDSMKSHQNSNNGDTSSIRSAQNSKHSLSDENRKKNGETPDPVGTNNSVGGKAHDSAKENATSSAAMKNSAVKDVSNDTLLPSTAMHQDDTEIADLDITDVTPFGHDVSPSIMKPAKSRNSSISLFTSLAVGLDDIPFDQTFPLLSLSSTSILDGLRQLFDDPMQKSGFMGTPSMTDLVDSNFFGNDEHRINGSLSRLRNPRIKKHYQDPPQIVEPGVAIAGSKDRQKSFGVIPLFTFDTSHSHSPNRSSTESDVTIDEISQSGRKGDTFIEPLDLQEVASK